MIEMRKTVPKDVARMKPKAVFFDNDNVLIDVLGAIQKYPCYTFESFEGEILAIIGYTPIHAKAGEIWSVTSEAVNKYPISFHRKCLEALDAFIKASEVRRLQMVVRVNYFKGMKWATALGFSLEGTLKSYGPSGEDYHMFGRVI